MLILVSLASVLAAGGALWAWISPETIGLARTSHLLGLLGLFVLPVATLAAMEHDRRRRGHEHADDETPRTTPSFQQHALAGAPSASVRRHPSRQDNVTPGRRRVRSRWGYSPAGRDC